MAKEAQSGLVRIEGWPTLRKLSTLKGEPFWATIDGKRQHFIAAQREGNELWAYPMPPRNGSDSILFVIDDAYGSAHVAR